MHRLLLHLLGCLLIRSAPKRTATSYLPLASTPMAPAPAPDAVAHLERCLRLNHAYHHHHFDADPDSTS